MFALVIYLSPSQKKLQDTYKNRGLTREKRIIFLKLAIQDDRYVYLSIHIYIYIYICRITLTIFLSHQKSLKKCLRLFNKEKFYQLPSATYQKELYFLVKKSGIFFHRVNIEIGLTPLPLPFFVFLCFFKNAPPAPPQ